MNKYSGVSWMSPPSRWEAHGAPPDGPAGPRPATKRDGFVTGRCPPQGPTG